MKHRRRQRLSGVWRSIGANAGRVSLALAASWVAFIVLLLIPMAVPDEPVIARYEAGVGIAKSSVEPLPVGGLADSFVECVEVLMFSGQDRFTAVARAEYPVFMTVPCSEYEEAAAYRSLDSLINRPTAYFRYWHGSSFIIRPVFAYLGMPSLRQISAAAVLASTALWFLVVARRANIAVASVALGVVAASSDLPWLAFSVHHAISITAILLYSAFLLFRIPQEGFNVRKWLVALAAVGGSVTAFFDVLNVAPVGWSLMTVAIALGLLARRPVPGQTVLKVFFVSGISSIVWIGSFALTWVVRWAITVPIEGWQGVYANLAGASGKKLSSSFESALEGWTVTLAWWERVPLGGWRPALVVLAVAGVVLLVRLVVARGRRWALLARVGVAAWAAVLVPIWFLAFGRHAADHGWFMYRGWAYALGIVAAAAFIPLPKGGWARGRRPLEENLGDTPRLPLA